MTYITTSAEETQFIAARVARSLCGGERISLIGELGSGKTTFAQGLVAALGSTARVKSPTFAVMNEYDVDGHPSIRRVIHCDFYRFTHAREIDALELSLYRQPDTVILVEWPDILPDIDWNPDITVSFEYSGESARTVTVDGV